jgi:hypothetical protein
MANLEATLTGRVGSEQTGISLLLEVNQTPGSFSVGSWRLHRTLSDFTEGPHAFSGTDNNSLSPFLTFPPALVKTAVTVLVSVTTADGSTEASATFEVCPPGEAPEAVEPPSHDLGKFACPGCGTRFKVSVDE